MPRPVLAAALALTVLPFAALDAAAAPGAVAQYGKTYNMTCMVQGKQLWIWNTHGPAIKEGAKIRLRLRGTGMQDVEKTVIAYRAIKPRERIEFDASAETSFCEARVTVPPDTATMTKPAPWQKKLAPNARAPRS
jgi:hypothetical protein